MSCRLPCQNSHFLEEARLRSLKYCSPGPCPTSWQLTSLSCCSNTSRDRHQTTTPVSEYGTIAGARLFAVVNGNAVVNLVSTIAIANNKFDFYMNLYTCHLAPA